MSLMVLAVLERFLHRPPEVAVNDYTSCEEFIARLNGTTPGQEAIYSRFRSPARGDPFADERVCIKIGDEVVSICDARISEEDEAEVGFITDPDYQGRGCAHRSLGLMLDRLQGKGIRRVVFNISEENAPAINLVTGLGASLDVDEFLGNRDDRGEGRYVINL